MLYLDSYNSNGRNSLCCTLTVMTVVIARASFYCTLTVMTVVIGTVSIVR